MKPLILLLQLVACWVNLCAQSPYLFPDTKENASTYTDSKRTMIIAARFRGADEFSEDVTAVRENGWHGHTNLAAEYMFPLLYDDVLPYKPGIEKLYIGESNSASDTAGAFCLTFATFNHAHMFHEGTTTYSIYDRNLTISKQCTLPAKDTMLFTGKLTSRLLAQLKVIRLDRLKDFYMNWCVMATSGNEYSISIGRGGSTKKIGLHHYYLKEIDRLVRMINSAVSKKYKIKYLNNDPDNYCDGQVFEKIRTDASAH